MRKVKYITSLYHWRIGNVETNKRINMYLFNIIYLTREIYYNIYSLHKLSENKDIFNKIKNP